jgi:hypothetical protein
MTLTDCKEPTVDRSITVNATSMRWGNDGVGLRFVFQDDRNRHGSHAALEGGVDKRQLDSFLQQFRDGKG